MPLPSTATFGLAVPASFGTTASSSPTAWAGVLEAPGVDALWSLDQPSGRRPTAEPITQLGYVAALTSRVRLGIAVLCGPARGPVALAKALTTLDGLSDGRLTVGLGLGNPDHYPAFGLDRAALGAGTILDELVRLLPRLWTEEDVVDAGLVWDLDRITITPAPVQQPHPPLWIGGGGHRARERVARWGSGWIGAGRHSNSDFVAERGRVVQAVAAAGRDPSSVTIAKRVYVHLCDDASSGTTAVEDWFASFYGRPELGPAVTVVGGVDACAEGLAELVDLGCDHVIVHPLAEDLATYETLVADVLPALVR